MNFLLLKKINKTAKFIRKYPDDLRGYALVKVIWDELNLTSWSLSSSFYKKDKMYLEGVGDPTNGNFFNLYFI